MVSLRLPAAIALVAVLLWRVRYAVKNILFLDNNFPSAYYAAGPANEQCRVIRDEVAHAMKHCEDVKFWDALSADEKLVGRNAILSCDPGRLDRTIQGSLWIYPARADSKAVARRIALEGYPDTHDFHPLGLDVSPARPGQPSMLFVVNLARTGSAVEQFLLSWDTPDRAKWIRTLSSPYIVAPNSIAMTSPSSFYITNDHLFTHHLPSLLGQVLPVLETYLALPLGSVGHVTLTGKPDASGLPALEWSLASAGIPFANGIAISSSGELVAVASTSGAEVLFYARNNTTHKLTFKNRMLLPFAVDNLAFDDTGALIAAGHPHSPSVGAMKQNNSMKAPSWAVTLHPRDGLLKDRPFDAAAPVSAAGKVPPSKEWEMETLYQSNGEGYASSTTALRDGETGSMFLSGLFDEGLLICSPVSS